MQTMSRIELRTLIAAPAERCFDLSLSVELHLDSAASSGELTRRNELIRELAETDGWRNYLPGHAE